MTKLFIHALFWTFLAVNAHAACTLGDTACEVTQPAVFVSQAPRQLTVQIDMNDLIASGRFNPKTDQVGIRGALAPMSWQQTLQARPRNGGIYELQLTLNVPLGANPAQPVQYKFKIERPGAAPNDGWEEGTNHVVLLSKPTQTLKRAFGAAATPAPAQRSGQIDELGLFRSKHALPRAVQVWLPPGYKTGNQRYPVLYLHDGQAMFDARAAGAEWQVDETAQRLITAGEIAPVIIVAVDSTRERVDDYTPTAMLIPAGRLGRSEGQRMGGGAVKYARFLIEELKPLIDQKYRTQTQSKHTTVGGSSLGGVVSMRLAMHYSDVFGNALVVSPSVWWDDQFTLKDVQQADFSSKPRPKIWLDMGGLEGAEAIPATRLVRDALIKQGWDVSNLAYLEQSDGSHDEASWALRFDRMLLFLYGQTDQSNPTSGFK